MVVSMQRAAGEQGHLGSRGRGGEQFSLLPAGFRVALTRSGGDLRAAPRIICSGLVGTPNARKD